MKHSKVSVLEEFSFHEVQRLKTTYESRLNLLVNPPKNKELDLRQASTHLRARSVVQKNAKVTRVK